jgi:hypothetical protein
VKKKKEKEKMRKLSDFGGLQLLKMRFFCKNHWISILGSQCIAKI